MTEIPKSHPRYLSLKMREALVKGVEDGITSKAGLIAHGRGEMFDYLIGEESIKTAKIAERKAIAEMMDADNPVISINGNVAALVPEKIVQLGKRLDAKLEVNLFHRTDERINKIKRSLEMNGAEKVYGVDPEEEIPGLDHKRALCSHDGIYTSDVVLVPLEDGDRAKALKDMGKKVITIDLNPLSRTSKAADITIVDNIIRAIPNMIEFDPLYEDFDNEKHLKKTLLFMSERLKTLSEEI